MKTEIQQIFSEKIFAESDFFTIARFEFGEQITLLCTLVWFIGVISIFTCFFKAHISFIRIAREATLYSEKLPEILEQFNVNRRYLKRVKIKESDRISSAVVYGIVKPTIIIPLHMQIDGEDKKRMILHEYIHVCHADILYKTLLTMVVCIHWFNPMVWIMYYCANRDIELYCDESVMKVGQTNDFRYQYGKLLIDLHAKVSEMNTVVHFNKTAIEERMIEIVTKRTYGRWKYVCWVVLPLVICIILLFTSFKSVVGYTETIIETDDVSYCISLPEDISVVENTVTNTLSFSIDGNDDIGGMVLYSNAKIFSDEGKVQNIEDICEEIGLSDIRSGSVSWMMNNNSDCALEVTLAYEDKREMTHYYVELDSGYVLDIWFATDFVSSIDTKYILNSIDVT